MNNFSDRVATRLLYQIDDGNCTQMLKSLEFEINQRQQRTTTELLPRNFQKVNQWRRLGGLNRFNGANLNLGLRFCKGSNHSVTCSRKNDDPLTHQRIIKVSFHDESNTSVLKKQRIVKPGDSLDVKQHHITQTCLSNILQYFTAVKKNIFR